MPFPDHVNVNFADYEAMQDAQSAELQLAIATVDGPSHSILAINHLIEGGDESRQCEDLGESCAENAGSIA